MSHIPHPAEHPSQAVPAGASQPMPGQHAPYGAPAGAPQGWVAPQSPAAAQAASRYAARAKNDTVAWLLWISGPFLVGLPIHDFYLGAIGRGLVKIGLMVLIVAGFIVGMLISPALYFKDSTNLWPLYLGIAVSCAAAMASLIWWIVDGVQMTARLERINDGIRREVAAEQGVDPWSF